MELTPRELREKTEKIGIHFAQSFPPYAGVSVGNKFIDESGATWIVGRIDNVIYSQDEYHVNGYCIREEPDSL